MPLKEVRNGALDAGILQQGTQKRASVRGTKRSCQLHNSFICCASVQSEL